MIFITGDTHTELRRFRKRAFPEQKEMTKDDYVIVAGDFGGIWYEKDDPDYGCGENYKLDELDARTFTTLFVPGNHENYDRLFGGEFPVKEWKGGLVMEIRPSILMLMRGEMFTIDGLRIFTFGGACSHDIEDGILDKDDPDLEKKIRNLKARRRKDYRIRGINWWEQERPTAMEMQHGLDVLEAAGWEVDYVVTHAAPSSTQILLGRPDTDPLTDYLELIHSKLAYKRWFFGHYHDNRQINEKDILLYEQIVRIC